MTTLRDLLFEYHVPMAPSNHKHVRPGWIGVDCPDCGMGSFKYHLGINETGLYTNCWRCGGKSLVYVLRQYTHLPWGQLRKSVANLETAIGHPSMRITGGGKVEHPSGVIAELPEAHQQFLKTRNVNPKEIQNTWDVKAMGWRLFIPIYADGRVVSWTTRSVGKASPAYRSARPDQEEVHHKHILYGEDYAGPTIIIVEGPLDAWRIGPGAVATFGVKTTMEQVQRMASHPRRVICYDADDAGRIAARRLLRTLRHFRGETINVELETGNDPSEANQNEIEDIQNEFL